MLSGTPPRDAVLAWPGGVVRRLRGKPDVGLVCPAAILAILPRVATATEFP